MTLCCGIASQEVEKRLQRTHSLNCVEKRLQRTHSLNCDVGADDIFAPGRARASSRRCHRVPMALREVVSAPVEPLYSRSHDRVGACRQNQFNNLPKTTINTRITTIV